MTGSPTRAPATTAQPAPPDALGVAAPQGGTFLFFDASPYVRPGESVMQLLERCVDAGVMLTPGSASGQAFESWVRLCFTAVSQSDLEDALSRLCGVLGR